MNGIYKGRLSLTYPCYNCALTGYRYAASVVTSVTYGKRIDSVDEWVVKENMRAMDCAFFLSYTFPLVVPIQL